MFLTLNYICPNNLFNFLAIFNQLVNFYLNYNTKSRSMDKLKTTKF